MGQVTDAGSRDGVEGDFFKISRIFQKIPENAKIIFQILFTPAGITDYDLQRNEVVALFNGFGRLSHSIVFLENFQKMALEAGETPVRKAKSPFSFKPEL